MAVNEQTPQREDDLSVNMSSEEEILLAGGQDPAPQTNQFPAFDRLGARVVSWDPDSNDFDRDNNVSLNTGEKTYVITHGFLGSGNLPWVVDLVNTIRDNEPTANVIVVDWARGSGGSNLDFNSVVDNDLERVGERTAQFLKDVGVDPSRTEIIGHSLGAHIAGEAGEQYQDKTGNSIGQIVGLDAAGSEFIFTTDHAKLSSTRRLDPSDADRVINFYATHRYGVEEGGVGHLNIILSFPDGNTTQREQLRNHERVPQIYNQLLQGEEFQGSNQSNGRPFNLQSLDYYNGNLEVDLQETEISSVDLDSGTEIAESFTVPDNAYALVARALATESPDFDNLPPEKQDAQVVQKMLQEGLPLEAAVIPTLYQSPTSQSIAENRDQVINYISATIDQAQETMQRGESIESADSQLAV